MSLTIDLPTPLDEALSFESRREGVPAAEHATLLLYLATALVHDEKPTPFQEAVRVFLSHNSLDAAQVRSVFESLVQVCLWHDTGKVSPEFQKALENAPISEVVARLREWRNATVHQGTRHPVNFDALITSAEPTAKDAAEPPPGRLERRTEGAKPDQARIDRVRSIRGKYAHLAVTSDEIRRERTAEDKMSERQLRGPES